MQINDALRWITQAMTDYANAQPLAAREATADKADAALKSVLETVRTLQGEVAALKPAPETPPCS